MRKRIMGMISLGMVFCLALAGCGSAQAKEQTTPEVAYATQEIWVQNGDNRIYGVAYVPASEADRKLPLVIWKRISGCSFAILAAARDR